MAERWHLVTDADDRPLSQDELFEFGCRVSEIEWDEAIVTSLPGDPMTAAPVAPRMES